MVGKDTLNELDGLLDDVARGRRRLDSIHDAKLREAVRTALRIHQTGAAAPDDYARLRMRARVLSRLDPKGPSFLDNAWIALDMLSRPAPYIVRGIALSALLVVVGMGATVAAADTLPDDLLYPVKLASEQVRLALATAPDDRASVEISIAEHRLSEAERLAVSGRTSDALVASAMYSQHVASAAAELVPSEASGVALQLESTFTNQRDRAGVLADTLSTNAQSAPAAQILATIAKPSAAPGVTIAERVAVTAAGVAEDLASVAEKDADAVATVTPRTNVPTSTARATNTPRSTSGAAVRTEAPRSTTDSKKANQVLQTVRKAADEAKVAADKVKSHK